MKKINKLLAVSLLFSSATGSALADNYSELIAFDDGSVANISFSFDLGTGYYTNVNGIVTGSTNSMANGMLNAELGTYMQLASYTPETLATLGSPEIPGTSFALFNSNNATVWQGTTAIFENFLIQNNQLVIDVANYGTTAAALYYPDLGYPNANLNTATSYSLTNLSVVSGVPLPSTMVMFMSGLLFFGMTGRKKYRLSHI